MRGLVEEDLLFLGHGQRVLDAQGHLGLKVANLELAVGDRDDALAAAVAAVGADLHVVLGNDEVVAGLAVRAEHLGQHGRHALGGVDRAGKRGEAALGLAHQVAHLGDAGRADGLDLLVGGLDGRRRLGERICHGLQRRDVDRAVGEKLARRDVLQGVRQRQQRGLGDIGERTHQRAGRRDVPTIDRHKGSKRPKRAAGLVLDVGAQGVKLAQVGADGREVALLDRVHRGGGKAHDGLGLVLHGLCLVVEREAADATHGEKHHHKHAHHNAHGAPAMAATLLDAADGLLGLRVVPIAAVKAVAVAAGGGARCRDVGLVIPPATVRRRGPRGQGLKAARGLAARIPLGGLEVLSHQRSSRSIKTI